MPPHHRLIELLQLAVEELRDRPNEIIMSTQFSSTSNLADFIEQAASRLMSGDLKAGHELFIVFGPTCDWDDAGGSRNLADLACELLEPYFIPSLEKT